MVQNVGCEKNIKFGKVLDLVEADCQSFPFEGKCILNLYNFVISPMGLFKNYVTPEGGGGGIRFCYDVLQGGGGG